MPTKKTTAKSVDPLLQSEEWMDTQRPRLHGYGTAIQNNTFAIDELSREVKELSATVTKIVGTNGDDGMIKIKIAQAIESMRHEFELSRNELVRDVSILLVRAFEDRDKVKAERWEKYKLLIFGGGVTVAVGVVLNIIEFFKEFVLK